MCWKICWKKMFENVMHFGLTGQESIDSSDLIPELALVILNGNNMKAAQ